LAILSNAKKINKGQNRKVRPPVAVILIPNNVCLQRTCHIFSYLSLRVKKFVSNVKTTFGIVLDIYFTAEYLDSFRNSSSRDAIDVRASFGLEKIRKAYRFLSSAFLLQRLVLVPHRQLRHPAHMLDVTKHNSEGLGPHSVLPLKFHWGVQAGFS